MNAAVWKALVATRGFETDLERIVRYARASLKEVNELKHYLTEAPQGLLPKGWEIDNDNILGLTPFDPPSRELKRRVRSVEIRTRAVVALLRSMGYHRDAAAATDWLATLEELRDFFSYHPRRDQHTCYFNFHVVSWVKKCRGRIDKGRSFPWDQITRVLQITHRVRGSENGPHSIEALRQSCRSERQAEPRERKKPRGKEAPSIPANRREKRRCA